MKKFLVLLLSAVCFTIPFHMTVSALCEKNTESVIEHNENIEQKIYTLLDARSDALFKKDNDMCEKVNYQLKELGVTPMTYQEVCELSGVPTMRVSASDNCLFDKFSIDVTYKGKPYTYMVVTAYPLNSQCNLSKLGGKDVFRADYFIAGKTTFLSCLMNAIGEIPYAGYAVTIYDLAKEVVENFKTESIVNNLDASYHWSLPEACAFVYLASDVVPGVYTQIGVFNKVIGSVSGTLLSVEFDKDKWESTGVTQTYIYDVNMVAPYFGAGSYCIKEYFDGKGFVEERVKSIDILGIDGETVTTVKLLNPDIPAAIH